MRTFLLTVVVALVVGACGPGEPAASSEPGSTSSSSPGITSTTSDTATTTTGLSSTTSSVPPGTTQEIDVQVSGGEVSGPDRFEVSLGDQVDIWILSDVDDEVHVHGYDLEYEVRAGEPFHLSFAADVPGIFEVETHITDLPLFEIEVVG